MNSLHKHGSLSELFNSIDETFITLAALASNLSHLKALAINQIKPDYITPFSQTS